MSFRYKKLIFGLVSILTFTLSSCSLFDGLSNLFGDGYYQLSIDQESITLNLQGQNDYYPDVTLTHKGEVVSGALNYSISNSNVCKIGSNNSISGLSVGESVLTISLAKNPSLQVSCSINVIDEKPTYTGIEFDQSSYVVDIKTNPLFSVKYRVLGENYPSQSINISFSDPGYVSEILADKFGTKKFSAQKQGEVSIIFTSKVDKGIKKSIPVSIFRGTDPEIVLSETELNIAQGKSKQIYANVFNSTDKNLVWTSSNPLVSVVDGTISVSNEAPIQTTAIIFVSVESKPDVQATCLVHVIEPSVYEYDYTIMFYMCASTLEYDNKKAGYFSEDIMEILSVENLPDSVKIIIETGGTKQWFLPSSCIDGATSISSGSLQRWEVCNQKLKLIQTLNTNYMASESSFEDFLEWGLKNYNAEYMGVNISGHGSGISGCAIDDNYVGTYKNVQIKNTLNSAEISNAAKTALGKFDRDKFTWIGYDACVMQCADNASINADYFEYMIGSQELEASIGWNHDEYLPLLASNSKTDPKVLLDKICETFVKSVHNVYCSNDEPCYQTLSVLDLSKAEDFTSAFNNYCDTIGCTSSVYNSLKSKFKSSSLYNFGKSIYGLVDFKGYIKSIESTFEASVESLLTAIDNLVISNYYCSKYPATIVPCGVNLFFPESNDSEHRLNVIREDYEGNGATKFNTWQTMCLAYGNWY